MDTNTPQDNSGKGDAGDAGQNPKDRAGAVQGSGGAQDGTGAGGATGAGNATGKQFDVPEAVQKQYPDLVEMIKKTESMSDEEREYWFQILPIMTKEQVGRLKKILGEEATQLAKLDQQYQNELSKLNKKHLEEWETFEKKQEREARQAEEAKAEKEESAAEDALLEELDEADSGDAGGRSK